MKNYVKPMVLANEELAEGVYAASGCLKMRWEAGSTDTGGQAYWKEFRIYPTHTSSTHCSQQQTVVITFNMPVTVESYDCTSVVGGDSTTLTCVRNNHMNGCGDEGGSFFVKVSPTSKENIESLTIMSYSITDTNMETPGCMTN